MSQQYQKLCTAMETSSRVAYVGHVFFFDNILLEKIYGLKQGVNPCFFFCWELTHIVFSAYLLENKD